ncbi:MAG: acetamidase, partial [bacterium]
VKKGVSRTVKFLREACSLDLDTALRLLSLVGEVGICQVVDPLMTIRIGLPWSVLNALGFSAEDL